MRPTRMTCRDACGRTRSSLFGLAPGGACRAPFLAVGAVRSYRTVSPLPSVAEAWEGGLLSAALSLGSPPPGVTRHLVSVEPGLSSMAPFPALPPRPSSHLIADANACRARRGQALVMPVVSPARRRARSDFGSPHPLRHRPATGANGAGMPPRPVSGPARANSRSA